MLTFSIVLRLNPEYYKGVLATYVSDIFNEEMFEEISSRNI